MQIADEFFTDAPLRPILYTALFHREGIWSACPLVRWLINCRLVSGFFIPATSLSTFLCVSRSAAVILPLYCCVSSLLYIAPRISLETKMTAATTTTTTTISQQHTNGTSLSVAASARNGHDSKEPETTKLGSTEKQPSSVSSQHHPTSKWTWFGYLLLVIVSKYTLPDDLRPSRPTLAHVWYYGWVTALSTGLGAAPLLLAHDMGKQMLGVGNAIAAGMMMSASYSLVTEGAMVDEADGVFREGMMGILSPAWARVALGVLAGLLFILSTKKVRARTKW